MYFWTQDSDIVIIFVSMCWCNQKKLSTMTADEYFEKHPELKKKFDDEIRNDYWGYWSCCCTSGLEKLSFLFLCSSVTVILWVNHHNNKYTIHLSSVEIFIGDPMMINPFDFSYQFQKIVSFWSTVNNKEWKDLIIVKEWRRFWLLSSLHFLS